MAVRGAARDVYYVIPRYANGAVRPRDKISEDI
jgi:hypothetical protein